MTKSRLFGVAYACLIAIIASSAKAATLNLTLQDFPDIVSGFISVDYAAGSDSSTTSGFALEADSLGGILFVQMIESASIQGEK